MTKMRWNDETIVASKIFVFYYQCVYFLKKNQIIH